ncbi:hypothetical protein HK405_002644, partial [Cladochytrium tenue]
MSPPATIPAAEDTEAETQGGDGDVDVGVTSRVTAPPPPATFTDANFPLDAAGRTYHVGTRVGEVAPRVLTVGDEARAERIAAAALDKEPAPLRVRSKRGFLTITGRFRGKR